MRDLRASDAAVRSAAAARQFEATREPLYQLTLRLTGRSAVAEDAVQETFVEVLRGIGAFRGEAKLTTWTFRVAIRTALRQRGQRRPPAEPLPDDLAARDGAPDATLDQRERAARLLAAIGRLPAGERAVVALAALRDLPQTEVAEILGVPVGTGYSRLPAARERLRRDLGLEPSPEPPRGGPA